ncbi:MAG: hypothetical protein HAW64_06090 [Alphaproteobacteria bacterium]|nr:hypothetical protein [Alphaproteobacteria bacterium]
MKIWTLTGGRRGNEVIGEGIAHALFDIHKANEGREGREESEITPMIVSLPPLWRPLRRTRLARDYVRLFEKRITRPFPDIVLASGAATIAHARAIRKSSRQLAGGKTFVAYLQDPHIAPHHFDFIWAPEHDSITGANVFKTLLTPHGLDAPTLTHAAQTWRQRLIPAGFSGTIIGFSMGGKSRAYPFSQKEMTHIARQLAQLAAQGHLILSAPSRRTPASHIEILRQALAPYPHTIWQAETQAEIEGDNPYAAILGLADQIIVTADSVNMIGEACTTGKPTYIMPLAGKSAKFNRFHTHLMQAGYAQDFTGTLNAPTPKAAPPNPTKSIAAKIYSALQTKNRL